MVEYFILDKGNLRLPFVEPNLPLKEGQVGLCLTKLKLKEAVI